MKQLTPPCGCKCECGREHFPLSHSPLHHCLCLQLFPTDSHEKSSSPSLTFLLSGLISLPLHYHLLSSPEGSVAKGFPAASHTTRGRSTFCSPGTGLPVGSSQASSHLCFSLPLTSLLAIPIWSLALAGCHSPFCITYPLVQPTPFPCPPTCLCPLEPVVVPDPPVHLNHPADSSSLSDSASAVLHSKGTS